MTHHDDHVSGFSEAVAQHTLADDGAAPEAGLLGRLIDRGGIVFAIAFLVSMAVLIFEIFMRYVLGSPTLWAHETTIFLCALSFVYGGLYCAARDKHIRVVVLYDYVPAGARRVLDVVISLLCAVSAMFFAWAAWSMVERSWWAPGGVFRLEGTGSAWDPPTPALMKGFLFLVMVVMAVQFVILAVNAARRGH